MNDLSNHTPMAQQALLSPAPSTLAAADNGSAMRTRPLVSASIPAPTLEAARAVDRYHAERRLEGLAALACTPM